MEDTCVCCGAVIPEGSMVCSSCAKKEDDGSVIDTVSKIVIDKYKDKQDARNLLSRCIPLKVYNR